MAVFFLYSWKVHGPAFAIATKLDNLIEPFSHRCVKSYKLENLAAAANALWEWQQVRSSSVIKLTLIMISMWIVLCIYCDFVEMMEKLIVVDEGALGGLTAWCNCCLLKKHDDLFDVLLVCSPWLEQMGLYTFLLLPCSAANATYRSALWYSAVSLARLGW